MCGKLQILDCHQREQPGEHIPPNTPEGHPVTVRLNFLKMTSIHTPIRLTSGQWGVSFTNLFSRKKPSTVIWQYFRTVSRRTPPKFPQSSTLIPREESYSLRKLFPRS